MKKPILLLALLTFSYYTQAQSTNPAPYCDASFDDVDGTIPVADQVKSVSMGTLNNVSNAQYAAPHYVYYNNVSVPSFTKGVAYTLGVTFEVHGGCGYGVWIDFNQNSSFEANEKVSGTDAATAMNISNNTVVTQSVTIPSTALAGNTRMRVRIVEDDNYTMGTNGYSIQPCNASTSDTDVMDWGETEDYVVNITSAAGINELTNLVGVQLYPNPVTNDEITLSNVNTDASYTIMDLNGNSVQYGKIPAQQQKIRLNNLAGGLYYFVLQDNEGILVHQKIVVTSK